MKWFKTEMFEICLYLNSEQAALEECVYTKSLNLQLHQTSDAVSEEQVFFLPQNSNVPSCLATGLSVNFSLGSQSLGCKCWQWALFPGPITPPHTLQLRFRSCDYGHLVGLETGESGGAVVWEEGSENESSGAKLHQWITNMDLQSLSVCWLLAPSASPPRGAASPDSVAFWLQGWSEGGFVAAAECLAPRRSQKLLLWQWQQQSDPAKWVRLSPLWRHSCWGVSLQEHRRRPQVLRPADNVDLLIRWLHNSGWKTTLGLLLSLLGGSFFSSSSFFLTSSSCFSSSSSSCLTVVKPVNRIRNTNTFCSVSKNLHREFVSPACWTVTVLSMVLL